MGPSWNKTSRYGPAFKVFENTTQRGSEKEGKPVKKTCSEISFLFLFTLTLK